MTNSLLSALERLTAITELLYDYEEEYSISDLAERLNVPIGVMRNDLVAIAISREFSPYLYSENEDFDTISDSQELAQQILNGTLDDMAFHLDDLLMQQDDFLHTVSLTLSEYQALENFDTEFISNVYYPLLEQKTICPALTPKTKEYRSLLQHAILKKQPMQIRYTSGKGELFKKAILPVAFSHNVLENLVYVISYENEEYIPYRIDRISHLHPSFDTLPYPADLRILEKLPYVWGMEYQFRPDVEPMKVKLAVFDEGNVLYKVKRDTALRPKATLYEEKDYWIYEDEVIGFHSFRSWVFSFGSSMVVLEPSELRDSIRQSYEERFLQAKESAD